jgi:uncharacterized protein YjbI with pentapeptide repeats
LVLFVVVVGLVVAFVGGYWFGWGWTGFGARTTSPPAAIDPEFLPAKTLWDWLGLGIVPLVLALVAFFFNRAERNNEQAIAQDRFRENALQTYLTQISELLLDKKLADTGSSHEARAVARMRTLTVLRQLDPARKAIVLKVLWDASLIKASSPLEEPQVDLRGADLRGAALHYIVLSSTDLREVVLDEAMLSEANLSGTDLTRASLRGADLRGADLRGADLRWADLRSVNLSGATVDERTNFWECWLHGAQFDRNVQPYLRDAVLN